jgi:hypothetical protein
VFVLLHTNIASVSMCVASKRLLASVKSSLAQLGMSESNTRTCSFRSQTILIVCKNSVVSPTKAISE